MDYCCEKFEAATREREGGFVKLDGDWRVVGCCGSIFGCCVITEMKFCPFCGKDVTRFQQSPSSPFAAIIAEDAEEEQADDFFDEYG